MNVHLRPNRSPIRPPSKSSDPNASAYAVTTHWRLSFEKCSARCADGSAMLTIVASSTTINCASPITARIHHRRSYWETLVFITGLLDRGSSATHKTRQQPAL